MLLYLIKTMDKIKLIWDFRGPDCKHTAKHQEIHLKEFFKIEKINLIESGTQMLNDLHCLAYVIILKENLDTIKFRLKPHRGELVE